MQVTKKDKTILRELARKVAEIGNDPVQKERAALWTRHNDLKPTRPLVLIFPEGSWREMLTDKDLQTSADCPLRGLEWDLRARIYYREKMQDDNVIEPVIVSPVVSRSTGWGISAQATHPEEKTGAYHFIPVLKTEADIEKIQLPKVTIDWDQTRRNFAELQGMFGDILTVELRGRAGMGAAPMDTYSQWRGLDQTFMDLVDNPQFVHKVMTRIMDGVVGDMEQWEAQGGLSLNNRNHYVGSGGNGYTRQLPQPGFDGKHVRPMDMWGHATAQIFSEVSPAMHEEFALRHEMRLMERCGLNCYGCCEPLHNKLGISKKIPRLRRISISPWADVVKSAAELGNKYIFSWKPNPAMVASEKWHPDHVRKVLKDFLAKTRGCVVEMVLKDTHTCRGEPQRMWEWTRIAREVAEESVA